MTTLIFIIILFIQILFTGMAFYHKDKKYGVFAINSIFITLLLILLVEVKLHHILRQNYAIPNTIFYLVVLLLLFSFFWFYRSVILRHKYWLLIITAVLWGISGMIDLLSDADIMTMNIDSRENFLLNSGSLSYLLFNITVLVKYFLSKNE